MLAVTYYISMNEQMTEIKISASLEDYLEALYVIIKAKQGVRAVDVARQLNVKKSSVTKALKTLSLKGLVNYEKYDVISLTEDGKKLAKRIADKHEILLKFFTNILGAEKDKSVDSACKIEHVISDELLERLIAFIQFCAKPENKEFINKFKSNL